MMAIEMVGGVYCPLSPRDPSHRLHTLVQQTHSRLVLVHYLTKQNLCDEIISLDVGLISVHNDMQNMTDVHRLTYVIVTPQHVAYIIFTSGSTGIPKAVRQSLIDLHAS